MESIFITKIVPIGSSHGIVIPTKILIGMNWRRGDTVVFGFGPGDLLQVRRLTQKEILGMRPDIKY